MIAVNSLLNCGVLCYICCFSIFQAAILSLLKAACEYVISSE